MPVCCRRSEAIDVDVTLVQIILEFALEAFWLSVLCLIAFLTSSQNSCLGILFSFFICFTCWNVRAWLHCQYFNSVQKYHYWFWYWCCLIMDGNESCPPAENDFKNESKSLAIRAPWEAIISQAYCAVWSWRLVVLQFFRFPVVELNRVHFSSVWYHVTPVKTSELSGLHL